MSAASEATPPTNPKPACGYPTDDLKPCGRAVHSAPAGLDPEPVCLMHSRDPNKDRALFRQEIDAILNGTSADHRAKDKFDFTFFVFPEAKFFGTTFTREADFAFAVFTQGADFSKATFSHRGGFFKAIFTRMADFRAATFAEEANFYEARFTQGAYFTNAEFSGEARFNGTKFAPEVEFSNASPAASPSPAIATFWAARFEKPERVLFYQVNKGDSQALRARFVNCPVEGVQFEDVNWHRERGRMALQDELDVQAGESKEYELVSTAYRRLVNNFEKVRAYDLAEDCFIGAMEMKRLDPGNFLFGRWEAASRFYEEHGRARKLGEWLSVLNLYRLLSSYGSSYARALGVLVAFLVLFTVLFPAFGLRMGVSAPETDRPEAVVSPPASGRAQGLAVPMPEPPISWTQAWQHSEPIRELWGTLKAGMWAALEVATFQREPTVEPASTWGRRLAVVEIIVIPGQVALLFLALRRRFRR